MGEAQSRHAAELKAARKETQDAIDGQATLKSQFEAKAMEQSAKLRDSQAKALQLQTELELANQKVERLNIETSAKSSTVEARLKDQIATLEN